MSSLFSEAGSLMYFLISLVKELLRDIKNNLMAFMKCYRCSGKVVRMQFLRKASHIWYSKFETTQELLDWTASFSLLLLFKEALVSWATIWKHSRLIFQFWESISLSRSLCRMLNSEAPSSCSSNKACCALYSRRMSLVSSQMQIILFCLATFNKVISDARESTLLSSMFLCSCKNFDKIYANDILWILITIGVTNVQTDALRLSSPDLRAAK